jgi:hypothetical protein
MFAYFLNLVFVSNFSIFTPQRSYLTLWVDLGKTFRSYFQSSVLWHGSPVIRIYYYPELFQPKTASPVLSLYIVRKNKQEPAPYNK